MEKRVFKYGGYHFIPGTGLKLPGRDRDCAISRRQRTDKELGLCRPGMLMKANIHYSHKGFYAASPDKECDLFRCLENGKLYLPAETTCRNIWNSLKKKRQGA